MASSVKSSRRRPEPLPRHIQPMLAVAGPIPGDEREFAFEYKWDGVRALCRWDGGDLTLLSRNLLDITPRYPELHALADALGRRRAMLDGEIVALDEADRPSFARLQRRMHVQDAESVRRLMEEVPVQYLIFDVLYMDNGPTMRLPLEQRRMLLEELTLAGPAWRISPAHVGAGRIMLETAAANGLEGVVAKRLGSVYEPGRRSPNWIKTKLVQQQEFVVGGWTEMRGAAADLGALIVGYYDAPAGAPCGGKLRYAGGVGSGFDAQTRRMVMRMLRPLARERNPFAERLPRGDVHFVEPEMVVEVEYRRWPIGGQIQQAAFKGVRTDKRACDVVKEKRM